MKPSIQMITIPVVNLLESEKFYRSMLELPEEQISAGDEHIAFFLEGDLSFVLFERSAFAGMTQVKRVEIYDHRHCSSLILARARMKSIEF